MDNVIPFDEDQAHADEMFKSWRMLNVIHDHTGDDTFEIRDQNGTLFALIHDGEYFIRLELTTGGMTHE